MQWPEVPSAALGAASFASAILLHYAWGHIDSFLHRGPFVQGLYIYPIKSCKGMKVSSAYITPRGFKYDRAYMLVSPDGVFITQRKYAKMALITPVVLEAEGIMVITAPGMAELRVPLESRGAEMTTVRVWGDNCTAEVIADNGAGEWFSKYLGADGVRLVRMADDFVRHTEPDYAPDGQTGFSDGFPFLLASEASIHELNLRLTNKITMERFRPNIVVGNVRAFAEDAWKTITVKGKNDKVMVMNVVKPCSRCPIPNIDPNTAQSNSEPTIAMKTFRTGADLGFPNPKWKREVFFGQNIDHGSQEGLTLEVGSDLKVLY